MRLRNALNLILMERKNKRETTVSDNQSKLSPWVVFSLAFPVRLAMKSHHLSTPCQLATFSATKG